MQECHEQCLHEDTIHLHSITFTNIIYYYNYCAIVNLLVLLQVIQIQELIYVRNTINNSRHII